MDTMSYLLGKNASGGGGGGDLPEKGVVFSKYDSDGYPTKVEFVGMTAIPDNYFLGDINKLTIISKISDVKLNNVTSIGVEAFRFNRGLQDIPTSNVLTTIKNYAFSSSNIINCNIPNSVTTIESNAFSSCNSLVDVNLPTLLLSIPTYAFQNCTNLETIKFPENLEVINSYAFQNCSKLNFSQLPSSLITIEPRAFSYCTSLKKFSINASIMIGGNTSNTSSFNNCTGLKQLWFGSSIINILRYSFNECTALEKIYIDKPRATVEGFAGYTYAFMNDTTKTEIIVCNDDEDFITQEEFDALEIE